MNRKILEKELKSRQEKCDSHYGKETKKDILTATIELYREIGIHKFYSCIMEECAELIQELSKVVREKEETDNIGLLEEIVDVELSIKMLKEAINLDREKRKYVEDIKIDALLEKLKKDKKTN